MGNPLIMQLYMVFKGKQRIHTLSNASHTVLNEIGQSSMYADRPKLIVVVKTCMGTRVLWHIKCQVQRASAFYMPQCQSAHVLTSIAPVVMGNKLLYIARMFIHFKSLYNHLLPCATGTIQIKTETCFSQWH